MANTQTTDPHETSAEASHDTKGLLRLTMACNEKCPFCNVPQEDYAKPTPPFEDVVQELQGFIDRGDKTLTISGGEPTLLRNRLIQLVTRAKAGGITFIEIQTNAVLIDADYASALRRAGVTSAFVSLLSHIPEHHETLAGLSGAFPKCLAGIDALLDADIRVALNPVAASLTQDLVADFVSFVGERLPRVRSISMSAVQPHGRAQQNTDLLPDYARLAPQIHEARRRAESLNIELLNPYCGLPLCIGWDDALEVSVEAIEAVSGNEASGLNNRGNKHHGQPCLDCTLRSRCGGAWHAYWEIRKGSGIAAPVTVSKPWEDAQETQTSLSAWGGPTDATWDSISTATSPVRWLWTDTLQASDIANMRRAGLSHLAVRVNLGAPLTAKSTLAVVRRLMRSNALVSPQAQVQLHLEWRIAESSLTAQQLADAAGLAGALTARSLTLTGPLAAQHADRIAQYASDQMQTGVHPD